MNKVYMEVTKDEFQLPLKIASSAMAMAEMCDTTQDQIYKICSRAKLGKTKHPRFICVVLDDGENNND